MNSMLRALFLAGAPLSAVAAWAEIGYLVKAMPEERKLAITITIPDVKEAVDLQMPNWAPGAYILVDSWRRVQDLKAADGSGKDASVEKVNDYTWRLKGAPGSFSVTYSVSLDPADGVMHYSGPSTYLYVVDRKTEACRLKIETPEGKWPIAVGLNEAEGKKDEFVAPDYDVLADNPVTMGAFLMDTYTFGGKPHYIVYRGAAKSQVDRERVKKACLDITKTQVEFWKSQPYDKYVWHFAVREGTDGAGGLEHLSSTAISMAAGAGPGVISVMSHEFFHLWNVKRVRSKPLGPFDYTKLPKTGALWWLEGVTDYYAALLLHRNGWSSEDAFLRELQQQVATTRANPRRLEISPYDSSYRVGEAANGRGNSSGFGVNYYNTGWVCGLLLDLEIRAQTGGKASLDDVCLALWEICKDNQPGFEEDAIRRFCVKVGGEKLGDYYDKIIMKPGELPVEEALAKVGLQMAEVDEPTVVLGFAWVADREKNRIRVRGVEDSAKDALKEGDLVLEVDGKPVEGTGFRLNGAMTNALRGAKAGVGLKLKIDREGQTLEVTVTPTAGTRKARRVVPLAGSSSDQVRLREGWLKGK
jgi:predicted metalloprotease with PDZ domain